MRHDDAVVKLLFKSVVGGLAYILLGLLIAGWIFGPAFLGYKGAFAADMAVVAILVFLVLWLACFPFLILVGFAIEALLGLLGIGSKSIKLR